MRLRASLSLRLLGLCVVHALSLVGSQGNDSLPLERFEIEQTGGFESWIDRRDLLVMHHPWVPSVTGGFCEARFTCSLPPDLKSPIRISLYQSDDYFNDFWRAKNDSWLGGDGFFGHRFKQVWVNDHLLWESDVADANPPQASGVLEWEIPEAVHESGKVDLTLKVVDKVSSWVVLASDTQHISTTETGAESPGDPPKFMTNVYWGDVQILSGTEQAAPGHSPAQARLEERLRLVDGTAVRRSSTAQPPYKLRLSCAAPLPKRGYPVRCGVPLPWGFNPTPDQLSLVHPNGEIIPTHAENFVKPSEDWTKWVAVEFLATSGMEGTELVFSQSRHSTEADHPIFESNPLPPEGSTYFAGNAFRMRRVRAETDYLFVECSVRFDPEHTVELVDLPLVEIRGAAEDIRLGYSERVVAATVEKGSEVVSPPGWIAIRTGKVEHFLSLRWIEGTEGSRFRIEQTEEGVRISLLPDFVDGEARPYPATHGEKRTFELLHCRMPAGAEDEECRRLAVNFNRPPLLVNTEVLGQTGVWGEGLPPKDQIGAELIGFLETTHPDPLGATFQWGRTLRDFGDIIYSGTDSWRNGYYDLRQGFAAAYLISGSREWADALDRAVRHFIDVDVIHWHGERPERVGLPHGYGENHTSMDTWDPILRANGIFAAAHLWGNRDYYDAALLMSRRAAENRRAVGAVSVRDHAGVMMTLAAACRETGDPLFEEAGRRLVEDVKTRRIDPRRGTYSEVHGNWNYRGNVPWMVAQLIEPLYFFHRETGDPDAARLVVGLADSILAENQERGVPGDIFGYSHNPHFTKSSNYHVLIAPSLFYAHELTGDENFREAAVAAWEQTVREGTINSVLNCFWNAPALVYYLREMETGGPTN